MGQCQCPDRQRSNARLPCLFEEPAYLRYLTKVHEAAITYNCPIHADRPKAAPRDQKNDSGRSFRPYVPKGGSVANLTAEQLQIMENRLDNRPPKVLGFKTRSAVFSKSIKRRIS